MLFLGIYCFIIPDFLFLNFRLYMDHLLEQGFLFIRSKKMTEGYKECCSDS